MSRRNATTVSVATITMPSRCAANHVVHACRTSACTVAASNAVASDANTMHATTLLPVATFDSGSSACASSMSAIRLRTACATTKASIMFATLKPLQ